MHCKKSAKYVYLHASGELSAWQRIRFERHMEYCSDCCQALKEYGQIVQTYQHVAQASTCSVTAEQVLRHTKQAQRMPAKIFKLSPHMRLAAATLIVVVVSTVAGAFWWYQAEKRRADNYIDIFESAMIVATSRESHASVFRLDLPQQSEHFEVLANEVEKLRRTGNVFSQDPSLESFQKTDRIWEKIKTLQTEEWLL